MINKTIHSSHTSITETVPWHEGADGSGPVSSPSSPVSVSASSCQTHGGHHMDSGQAYGRATVPVTCVVSSCHQADPSPDADVHASERNRSGWTVRDGRRERPSWQETWQGYSPPHGRVHNACVIVIMCLINVWTKLVVKTTANTQQTQQIHSRLIKYPAGSSNSQQTHHIPNRLSKYPADSAIYQ